MGLAMTAELAELIAWALGPDPTPEWVEHVRSLVEGYADVGDGLSARVTLANRLPLVVVPRVVTD